MENKEKFAFRKVSMTENVEVEFLKIIADNANKSDDEFLKVIKDKLSSDNSTCHASMLSRTPNQLIFQISKFSKTSKTYRDHEIWVFNYLPMDTLSLNRFRI